MAVHVHKARSLAAAFFHVGVRRVRMTMRSWFKVQHGEAKGFGLTVGEDYTIYVAVFNKAQ